MNDSNPAGPENAPQPPPAAMPPVAQQQQYAPPVHLPGGPVASASKGLAIAALIVGIVAVLTALVPILGIIVGLAGAALGIIALVKRQPKAFALTGTILSGVAIIVSIVVTIFAGLFTSAVIQAAEDTSVTMETPAETNAPADGEMSDGMGTRDNPYPMGAVISTDEWDIIINSVNVSANDLMADENLFNDAAPAGQQYMIVNFTAKYKGEDTGIPAFLNVDYVTKSGEVITPWDSLATAPEPTFGSKELYAGAEATGNIAMLIPSTVDGVLRVEPGIFADMVFVALK